MGEQRHRAQNQTKTKKLKSRQIQIDHGNGIIKEWLHCLTSGNFLANNILLA